MESIGHRKFSVYIFWSDKTNVFNILSSSALLLISVRHFLLIPFSKALNCTTVRSVYETVKIPW